MNPIAFFYLSKVLSDHYIQLKKLHRRSGISSSPSVFDWSGPRTLKRPSFESRDDFLSDLSARFEYIASADIGSFYHSIYTHTIAWAIEGKAHAKANRYAPTIGNEIDLLCRNGQDGQTVGLPVGPDTSRLIAEIVGSAIDEELQLLCKLTPNSAMRFVDDFTVGCASQMDAERVLASIRRATNHFELDLNSTKSSVEEGTSSPRGGWKEWLRSIVPRAPFNESDVKTFVFQTEELAKQLPEVNVQRFALQNARRAFLECSDWGFIENYVIALYKANPTVIDLLVELIILRDQRSSDVGREKVETFVNGRLPILFDQLRLGEASWLLHLVIALRLTVQSKCVSPYYSHNEPCTAVLITDAARQGLVKGAFDQSTWNKSLTSDGLNEEMWLYAYESTIKDWHSSGANFLTSHPFFSQLQKRKVEFYRSGQGMSALSDVLKRKRQENEAAKRIAFLLGSSFSEEIGDVEEEDDDLY